LNEGEYICEVLERGSARACRTGKRRTGRHEPGQDARARRPLSCGDIVVRRQPPCVCGRTWARLEGGVLARVDDDQHRGVNVYPAAIESVVRGFRSGGISIHRIVGWVAAIAPGRGRGGARVGRWVRSRSTSGAPISCGAWIDRPRSPGRTGDLAPI
jgi:hypothetical protein